ncbi:MAG: HWE histidine kinase domain-containing protein [Phenylobacterium sp.]|nr:HWE histidine kinase domain-containing protein [Phenylobacterium sp.]
MAWRAWLPDWAPRPWQSILFGATLGAAAVGVRLSIDSPLGGNLPFLTMFPALLVSAAFGGYSGGLACLVTGGLGVAWLFMPVNEDTLGVHIGFWISGALVTAVAAALSDSVRKLRRSEARLGDIEAQLRTLVGELAHRNRNALFVIMAIVRQSARSAGSAAEAEQVINSRLDAMLRAQDLVVQADGGPADLQRLVELALAPFDRERFDISGPAFQVGSEVSGGLALLFHELATNAVKYGALTTPEGRVAVAWTLEGGGARLCWTERGGPPLSPPSRRGFGARLFDVVLTPQGGKAERRFEPDGVVCDLSIPGPAARRPATAQAAGGAVSAMAAH